MSTGPYRTADAPAAKPLAESREVLRRRALFGVIEACEALDAGEMRDVLLAAAILGGVGIEPGLSVDDAERLLKAARGAA